jgi:hypothetical protein
VFLVAVMVSLGDYLARRRRLSPSARGVSKSDGLSRAHEVNERHHAA